MASRSEIERLRAEVISKHAAASAKISRNRAKGIELAGSQFDVRREIAKVRRYNMKQLDSYLRELVNFTGRSTQFVAGSKGKPIPRNRFDVLKGLEDRVNKLVEHHENKIANIFLPSSGMTIREREERFGTSRRKSGQGEVVNRPFQKFNREAFRINGAQAAEALIKDMQKRLSPKYLNSRNRANAKGLTRMLIDIGDDSAIEKLHALSPNQLDILLNHTKFASALAQTYGFNQMDVDGKYANTVESNMDNVHDMLNWASRQRKK